MHSFKLLTDDVISSSPVALPHLAWFFTGAAAVALGAYGAHAFKPENQVYRGVSINAIVYIVQLKARPLADCARCLISKRSPSLSNPKVSVDYDREFWWRMHKMSFQMLLLPGIAPQTVCDKSRIRQAS